MEEGTTSIDELLKSGGSVSDESMVDSILEEINATKGQQVQKKMSDQEIMQRQAQAQAQAQAEQMRNQQLRIQQEQLESLVKQNQMKDKVIQDIQENNRSDTSSNTHDLLQEFKPTIIIFILISIFTLPVLNKFVVTSIGIEENSIFSILKCFIICIIFFLINKFI